MRAHDQRRRARRTGRRFRVANHFVTVRICVCEISFKLVSITDKQTNQQIINHKG